jgi:hypothetical protein
MRRQTNISEYRRLASECLKISRQTFDPKNRALLIEMATAWARLADQADRNSKADLTYGSSPRPLRRSG